MISFSRVARFSTPKLYTHAQRWVSTLPEGNTMSPHSRVLVNGITGSAKPIEYKGFQVNAFVPRELPPTKIIMNACNTQMMSLYDALETTQQSISSLQNISKEIKHIHAVAKSYMKKEAVFSNTIENNSITFHQFLDAETSALSTDPFKASELQDIYQTLEMMENIDSSAPVSIAAIDTAHTTVMKYSHLKEKDIGKLRTKQNFLGNPGMSLHELVFPPPPEDVLPLMQNLCDFMNSQRSVHPLLAIGIAHAQFELIHPFLDGNGRVGRVLMNWDIRKKVLSEPLCFPSFALSAHQRGYFESFCDIMSLGRWESFCHFWLAALSDAMIEAEQTTREILEVEANDSAKLSAKFSTTEIDQVLNLLYANPYISHAKLKSELGLQLSDKVVPHLVQQSIIELKPGSVNVYQHSKYLSALLKPRHIDNTLSNQTKLIE